MVGAINNHVLEAVKYKRELTDEDLKVIKTLVYESHNHLSILKGLATRFQRLSLG